MSIQSEIDRIKAGKADAKAALIERGVDPGDAPIDDYGNKIRAIPSGVTSFNGRTGAVEPQAGDYTAEMVGADPAGSADSAISSANSYTDISIQNISSELSRISGELSSLYSTVMGIQSELSNLSYTANEALSKAEEALNRISAMGG